LPRIKKKRINMKKEGDRQKEREEREKGGMKRESRT
jgi:hypothetical protein